MTVNQYKVFYTHFLSPTDPKCAELSTYWQFFYYRPPGKFRYRPIQQGEIVKMWCQELDVYIYIYIQISPDHHLDNRYGFSVSVRPEHTPLLQFFMLKKMFFTKSAGPWLVGEVVNHLCFMELWRPRVARCSNVGLVYLCYQFLWIRLPTQRTHDAITTSSLL